jgi:hypothetical protein
VVVGFPLRPHGQHRRLGIDLTQGDWDVLAEEKGSRGLPDLFLVDLRLEKAFGRVRISADVFNLLNANTVT